MTRLIGVGMLRSYAVQSTGHIMGKADACVKEIASETEEKE